MPRSGVVQLSPPISENIARAGLRNQTTPWKDSESPSNDTNARAYGDLTWPPTNKTTHSQSQLSATMPITSLPDETANLLTAAAHYPSFESAVERVFTLLHPRSASTTIQIHPEALRFTISFTPTAPIPPLRATLRALSTLASVELQTPDHRTHFRSAHAHARRVEGGRVHAVHVWELFHSTPVRRRLESLRDPVDIASSTRERVVRAALRYAGRAVCLVADGTLFRYTGALSADALQQAFGLRVTWVRVQARDGRGRVTGFLAREGTGTRRYQLAAREGLEDGLVVQHVNSVWRRVANRCAAFVVMVEGVVGEDLVERAIREALGVVKERDMKITGVKKRKPGVERVRFGEAMPGKPARKRPLSDGRLSVRVSRTKRPASAVEDAYKRMIPSWRNPCLPSRGRKLPAGIDDKRAVCMTKERIAKVRIVGQVDRKFIVVADDQGIYALDQHAASERFLYELMLRRCLSERGSTKLANPRMVDIPVEFRQYSDRVLKIAKAWGWRFEDGQVTHVPQFPGLDIVPEPESLVEWFEEFAEGGRGTPRAVTNVTASAACHKAVRFGDVLTREMCSSIVACLAECEVPFLCAHGRPNVVPLVAFDNRDV